MHNRKIFVGVTSLFFVGLLVVTGNICLPSQAKAQEQCHKINTTLTSIADFDTFTTEGEIKSGFLKGTTMLIGDPTSQTPITSEALPPLEPLTFSYTGNLEITTRKGILITRSVGVFEAVPFGLGTQFDRVIDGTGLFDGAEGYLFLNYKADDTGGGFTSSVRGEICVY